MTEDVDIKFICKSCNRSLANIIVSKQNDTILNITARCYACGLDTETKQIAAHVFIGSPNDNTIIDFLQTENDNDVLILSRERKKCTQ